MFELHLSLFNYAWQSSCRYRHPRSDSCTLCCRLFSFKLVVCFSGHQRAAGSLIQLNWGHKRPSDIYIELWGRNLTIQWLSQPDAGDLKLSGAWAADRPVYRMTTRGKQRLKEMYIKSAAERTPEARWKGSFRFYFSALSLLSMPVLSDKTRPPSITINCG